MTVFEIARDVGTIEILVVEDNPSEVDLVNEVFKSSTGCRNVHAVGDGVEAMEFLRRQGRYAGAPRPDLIMLDLNLPRKDGRDVLREIKSDPALRRIPVVVLSISEAEQDVRMSYDLHANCYVTKPGDLDQYLAVARSIKDFWLRAARLPREHGR